MSQDQLVSDGSLSNIRVLDLTRVWAGPLATRIMGDFGEVVTWTFLPNLKFTSVLNVTNDPSGTSP